MSIEIAKSFLKNETAVKGLRSYRLAFDLTQQENLIFIKDKGQFEAYKPKDVDKYIKDFRDFVNSSANLLHKNLPKVFFDVIGDELMFYYVATNCLQEFTLNYETLIHNYCEFQK